MLIFKRLLTTYIIILLTFGFANRFRLSETYGEYYYVIPGGNIFPYFINQIFYYSLLYSGNVPSF